MSKYYVKDSRQLAKFIKDTVDLIITSPPYFDMKDYGMKGQIGFGQEKYNDYLNDLQSVFSQCLSITKETGSMWIIVDTLKRNGDFILLPFNIIEKAKEVGWQLQEIVIWRKDRTLPYSGKGEMRNIFEYVLFFAKDKNFKYYPERIKTLDLKHWWVKYPERYSIEGKAPTDIWEFPIPVQGSWGNQYVRHFCPLPQKMVEQIIELCSDSGDTVLDPFAGSGAVLIAAHELKRKYIGCDLNPDYKEMFEVYLKKYDRQDKQINLANEKNTFAEAIRKLRLLKLPSALLKNLRRNNPDIFSSINGILVDPATKNCEHNNHLWHAEYTFFVKDNFTDSFKELIEALLHKAPLSKYGIHTEVKIDFSDIPSGHKTLNAYIWDATYKPPLSFEEISQQYVASKLYFTSQERRLIDSFQR